MFVVAVSGDIGAGKTTLTRLWGDLGARVLHADEVAKALWERRDLRQAATDRWGEGLFDEAGGPLPGEFLRRAFASREDHRFLGRLLHPLVWDLLRGQVRDEGWWVLEVPLLFETGVPDWVDGSAYVAAPAAQREDRVFRARGWTRDELALRELWLLPGEEKARASRWVLDNDGDREAFLRQGRDLGRRLRRLASVVEGDVACGSPEEADRIARALVEQHLAACTQRWEVRSLYRWRREVAQAPEWLLSFRTLEERIGDLERAVREHHAYELPVLSFRVPRRLGLEARLWVEGCCTP